MSRIDEAMKRAASGQLAEDQHGAMKADPRARDVGASMLERYALEEPLSAPDSRQALPVKPLKPVNTVVAVRVDRPVQVEAFPASLEGKLVVSRGIAPATVEQYRRLAAALHDLQLQRGLKTLLVSSALPREGKTLTIANLALTLTESYGQRVLVIDADFRHPSLHEVFGLSSSGAGLADVLRSGEGPLPIVEISSRLSVLPAGRSDTNLLAQLTSDRFGAVVRDAAAHFDWVLLDTPPVCLLPDAQLVARASDGILFVIAAGTTPYTMVQRGIAELGADRIVGTLLNRVEERSLYANDYYGHYPAQADTSPA